MHDSSIFFARLQAAITPDHHVRRVIHEYVGEILHADETPYETAVRWLAGDGVQIAISLDHASMAVLVANATNFAAKAIGPAYYRLKPTIIDYAADLAGVTSGWGDDGAFYLFTPRVGAVSFHDPAGEIMAGGTWPHGWSGYGRQEHAFQILAGDLALLDQLARLTTPEALR